MTPSLSFPFWSSGYQRRTDRGHKCATSSLQRWGFVSEPELNIYLRESEFPELKNYIGDDLLVTDGTSLLG